MELNLEMKQQLEKLLAKPALVTEEHLPLLQNLVKVYPYYQPLYLLLAKACFGTENQSGFLATAALYNNGNVLHQIIHEPYKVTPLRGVQVIEYKPWSITQHVEIENAIVSDDDLKRTRNEIEDLNNQEHPAIHTEPDQFFKEITTEEVENISIEPNVIPEPVESFADETVEVAEAPEIENLKPLANEVTHCSPEGISEEKVLEPASNTEQLASVAHQTLTTNEEPLPIVEQAPVVVANSTFVLPEIENLAPLANELLKIGIISNPIELEQQTSDVVQPLTTEQEIVIEVVEDEKEILAEEAAISAQPETNIESLTIESIAANDFFAFETNFTSEKVEDESPITDQKTDTSTHSANKYEYSDTIISKYDDDKLPFSFLWWLSKTRKNHEQIFKPFVSPAKLASPTAALQQQYVENIFHLQTSFSDENTAEENYNGLPKMQSKENELVENFIKNDPQIKVPKPDQINNDNKAKKSAEDNYDVVSETLAQIYIEQVLYHKAIDTYQKLSLKFPEKSRYFADLILSLEKKI